MYPPSMIACACVVVALKSEAQRQASWDPSAWLSTADDILNQLQTLTQIEKEILRGCCEQVEHFMRSSSSSSTSSSSSSSSSSSNAHPSAPSASSCSSSSKVTATTSSTSSSSSNNNNSTSNSIPSSATVAASKNDHEQAGTPTDVRDIHF